MVSFGRDAVENNNVRKETEMLDLAVIILACSLFVGGAFLFLGIRNKKGGFLLVGAAVLTWSILLLIAALADNVDLFVMLLSFAIGALLIWLGILSIVDAVCCNQKISAVYVGAQGHKYKYSPIFEYDYNGAHYCVQVGTQVFSHRYLCRHFQEKESTEIYVNPRKPHRIVVKRKVQFSYVFLLLMGFAFIALFGLALLDLVFSWGMISM